MNNTAPSPTLLSVPQHHSAELSAHFDTPEYRLSRTQPRATWTTKVGTYCDECAQLQHETRGASGPRMQPKQRRTVARASLALCNRHANAWHDRDDADAPAAAGRKARR